MKYMVETAFEELEKETGMKFTITERGTVVANCNFSRVMRLIRIIRDECAIVKKFENGTSEIFLSAEYDYPM